MRYLLILSVAAAVVAVPARAAARPLCGPSAPTISENGQVRVYVLGTTARGCSRAGRRTVKLGTAGRVLAVTLKGRYAAVRRREARGQSLRVYDLRIARTRGEKMWRSQFTAVSLDSAGVAAFIAPEGVGDTLDGVYPIGTAIDPAFVRVLGPVVAWRDREQLKLRSLTQDRPFEIASHDGTLDRQGEVAITLKNGQLHAQRQTLGSPLKDCLSPSSCTGIETIAIAGVFVAVQSIEQGPHVSLTETLALHNLATGTTSQPCSPPVETFTLDATGAVTCTKA